MLNPKRSSPDEAREPIAEIGSILAVGLKRLRARKSSDLSAETGESSLHFSPAESGHEPQVLTPGGGS